MEDGPGARANLAKAAAAFVVLSLLPVALSGSAPSHASAALRPISFALQAESSAGVFPWSSPLFAAFQYDRGQVLGTYVQFAYDASTGTMKSILGLAGEAPVLYVGSIRIAGFAPSRGAHAIGSTFEAQGYLVTITVHDDPTVLVEIRTDVARTATIELPAGATNVSVQTAPGSWPASSVSYSVGDDQARFLLGAGTFSVSGIRIVAKEGDVNRTESPLPLFLTNGVRGGEASYSVLSFPGTVVALYLPSLAAVSVEVVSSRPEVPGSEFQAGSEVAMIAALAIVSAAAARMLRRRAP